MLKVGVAAQKLMRSVRGVGVSGTIRRATAYLPRRKKIDAFDQEHAVETAEPVPLWKLTIDSDNLQYGNRYQTASVGELERDIGAIPCNREETAFVDLGCGKGRPLLIAHSLGFRNLIGVEFSESLAKTAIANLGDKAKIIFGDAADYRFAQGPLVLFMYNPFESPVMQSVLKNLRDHHGDLWVLYTFPRHADLLDQCGFLRRLPLKESIWRRT